MIKEMICMFCPRCGRPVSDTANFCGGCGLPKAEIERMCQVATPAPQPEKTVEIDMTDINSTISQLEGDLTGINPVENYTTETPVNTNKVEDDFLTLEPLQAEESAVSEFEPAAASYSAQSDYSKNAPKHPVSYRPKECFHLRIRYLRFLEQKENHISGLTLRKIRH